MTIRMAAVAICVLGLGACSQASEDNTQTNEAATPNQVVPPPAPAAAENVQSNVSLPDDRTPLEEPKGPIDPKSVEAAGQVVQHYGTLIEQGRWTGSWRLWTNPAAAKSFDRNWRDDTEVHMEIGKPGGMEGAAGSSYITTPAVFYGKTKSGGSFRRAADVILRRVNDVPGSTEAQRRWRIERIELKA